MTRKELIKELKQQIALMDSLISRQCKLKNEIAKIILNNFTCKEKNQLESITSKQEMEYNDLMYNLFILDANLIYPEIIEFDKTNKEDTFLSKLIEKYDRYYGELKSPANDYFDAELIRYDINLIKSYDFRFNQNLEIIKDYFLKRESIEIYDDEILNLEPLYSYWIEFQKEILIYKRKLIYTDYELFN